MTELGIQAPSAAAHPSAVCMSLTLYTPSATFDILAEIACSYSTLGVHKSYVRLSLLAAAEVLVAGE